MPESKSGALPTWRYPNDFVVCLQGFEPRTLALEGRCSIQLSYRHIFFFGAGEGDRTLATGLEGQGSTTELHPRIYYFFSFFGAEDEIRTRDPRLGKAMLYH